MRRRGQQKKHQHRAQKKVCKNRQIQAQQNRPHNINTIMWLRFMTLFVVKRKSSNKKKILRSKI